MVPGCAIAAGFCRALRFTLPWRGRVGEHRRCEPGWGELPTTLTPPRRSLRSRRPSPSRGGCSSMRLALRAIASPELSRSRSRGTICARGLRAEAPSKNEGGAGRRGPDGPTGSDPSRDLSGTMLFDEAPSESQNRKSAISPASRARCLKPALHDPRWSYLSGARRFRRGSPNHRCGGLDCRGRWASPGATAAKSPR